MDSGVHRMTNGMDRRAIGVRGSVERMVGTIKSVAGMADGVRRMPLWRSTSPGLPLLPGRVKFLAMKTVTVQEAESNFSSVLRIVRGGEEVAVTSRKKTIAKIVPVTHKRRKYDWASTWAKVDEIFGGKPAPGKAGSQIIIEGRR